MSVFCYVAHKGDYWAGLISPEAGAGEVARFVGKYMKSGFTITSFATREEYSARLDTMKMWHESPDYKPKRKRSSAASPKGG